MASKQKSKALWYVIVIIILVIGGLYFLLRSNLSFLSKQLTTQQLRSKPLGVITNVVTASSLDVQGNAISPTATFAPTDKAIYLALTVNSPKVGTKFEYIRYLNNKYLDNSTTKISKPNVTNTSFVWNLKPGAIHLAGVYRVKIYTNGVFEKETFYTVR